MDVITTTQELAQACARLAQHPYVTVDTEFLRESTYFPILCVAQMASPDEAVVIDTRAQGIDLGPFFELLANEAVLKVFGGYRNCAQQPQGWHQYASGLDIQPGYSAIASPGFWRYDQTPTVPRDPARFRRLITEQLIPSDLTPPAPTR